MFDRRDFLKLTGLAALFAPLLPVPSAKPSELITSVRLDIAVEEWLELRSIQYEVPYQARRACTVLTYRGTNGRIDALQKLFLEHYCPCEIAMWPDQEHVYDNYGGIQTIITFRTGTLRCVLRGIWQARMGVLAHGETGLQFHPGLRACDLLLRDLRAQGSMHSVHSV